MAPRSVTKKASVKATEVKAPAAKKGKKKNVEEAISEEKSIENGNHNSDEESSKIEDIEQNEENTEANGHLDEKQSGRGRKKQTKKDTDKVVPEKKSGRGRKNVKHENAEENEDKEVVEKKPKSSSKAKGRKLQPKESESEVEDEIEKAKEDVKTEHPAAKGRKKGQTKVVKEKTPESEDVDEDLNEVEEEEPKKKETKSRKNQSKKPPAKNDEEKEEAPPKKRKGAKKDEKDVKIEDPIEEEVTEAKPVKGKRGQKKKLVETVMETEEEPQDTVEPVTKRRRKAEEKAPEESKNKIPPKNKASTNYEEIDFSNTTKDEQGKDWNFKIASWNVDGIRAWFGKGGLDYIKHEKPDILCLQEVKCAKNKLPDEIANVPGYHAYWLCSEKDGYAGVGVYTTKLAMNVQYGLQNEELDDEGRIITAEYEQFYLINTYVPNAGRKLVTLPKRLQWNEEFRKYVKELDKKKPVIICGDMNVSHNEIDLTNPKPNRKNAGFTDEERAGMTDLLGDGFIDTYRHLNPDKTGAYTFWSYMMNSRAKNTGWRLDYFIISERLLPSLCDNAIRDKVYGSDHCPISLFLHLSSAVKPKE